MILGVVAVLAQQSTGAMVQLHDLSIAGRLAQAAYSAAFYPRAMFFHWSFNPIYERPSDPNLLDAPFVLSVGALGAITIVAVLMRRRWPAIFVAWLAYLVLIAPVSGLAQAGMQLVADRYSYLPCMSLALLVGAGVIGIWRSTDGSLVPRLIGLSCAAALLVTWATLAWRQTHVWRDDLSLWGHTVRCGPSSIARNNLGWHLWLAGRTPEAIDQIIHALAIEPNHEKARQNLSMILMDSRTVLEPDQMVEAAEVLRVIATVRSDDAIAWHALGKTMLKLGEVDQARLDLERAVKADPADAAAWMHLGQVRMQMSDLPSAIDALTKAVEFDPSVAQAWLSLGAARLESGDAPGAVAACRKAVDLEPRQATTWTSLGFALLKADQFEEARGAAQRAFDINPGHALTRQLLLEIDAAHGGASPMTMPQNSDNAPATSQP